MRFGILILLLLFSCLYAQVEELDPSIFDGTGRETDKQETRPPPESASPGVPAQPGAEETEPGPSEENPGAPGIPGEESTEESSESSEGARGEENGGAAGEIDAEEGGEEGGEETPREIVLPGSGEEGEGDENQKAPPGVPASEGAGSSRAGESVESTEKIVPGQAVDFPWDM